MSGPLKDKVVLVTGSSIGIGRATAIKFAEEGCSIVVTYYEDEAGARETAYHCQDAGAPDVLVAYLNVMDDESIRLLVQRIVQRHGRIDILVNNAGIIIWKNLVDQSIEEIERQIRTNLEGTIKVTRECLPYLQDCVISLSGATALCGYATLVPYSATKAGIGAFTAALSREVGNIDVFTVLPKETATRMTHFHGDPPELVAEVIVSTAKRDFDIESGDDVKVWDLPPVKERNGKMPTIMSEWSS
jgi:3-oxoacyl-[acyl-carrier protein] reductase